MAAIGVQASARVKHSGATAADLADAPLPEGLDSLSFLPDLLGQPCPPNVRDRISRYLVQISPYLAPVGAQYLDISVSGFCISRWSAPAR